MYMSDKSFIKQFNFHIIYKALQLSTTGSFGNITATVLTSRSVEVTWYPLSNFTGYRILYTTNASYTDGGNVTVTDGNITSNILTNLEENTLYSITVQVIGGGCQIGDNSNVVSATTHTNGM